jgi:hypothetical protein
MNQKVSIRENDPCILVVGPPWPSPGQHHTELFYGHHRTEFYGRWLLAAAKADEVWKKVKGEPHYEEQLERVPNNYLPAFGATALWLVSQLANNSFSAIVSVNGREEEMRGWFLTMRHMDFFCFPDKRYKMILPHRLSMANVKNAVLAGVVRMNDSKLCLRPEYSSPTLTYAEAKAWQTRLGEMGEKRLH